MRLDFDLIKHHRKKAGDGNAVPAGVPLRVLEVRRVRDEPYELHRNEPREEERHVKALHNDAEGEDSVRSHGRGLCDDGLPVD